jgi:TP901 family phage tail tape measure protein
VSASSKLEILISSKADVGGFSTAEKSLGQLESRGQSAARGLSTLGTAATVAGGVLAAGLAGAVTAAANFESRMSAVKAASGATGSELAGLSAKALEFGAATDLAGIDANDAATAMEQLAKGGVSVSQMAEAAHGALLLASAGEISVAEAADTAVRAMNIFGLSGNDVAHVADVISAGANKSATDVGQLNAAFNQSASVAKGAGLSLEQLTGVLALLAQNGLQGSDAGTSLRTAISRLTAPTKEAAAEMEALGISVFDMNGKTRDFADIADNLKSSLSGLSDEQRSAALQTIFGSDAIRVANVLYKEGGTAVRTWTAAVNDSGSAARLGAERNDNLKGSIDQLKASLQTAAIAAGTALLPQIRELTKHVTDAVTWFGNLSPRVQTIAVDAAAGAAGFLLLVAATSKVVDATRTLGGAISDVIGWFAKKQAAKAALEGANKSLATSVGGTNTAVKGLALTLGESVLIIGGTALAVRGLMEVVGKTGEHFADVAQGNQNLTRELTLQQTALSQVGQAHKDIVSDFTAWVHLQDEATQKTTSAVEVYNKYVAFLNEIGTNTQNLQPITIATGLAVGALGAAFAQTAVSGRGLVDSANAIAAAMDAGTVAMARQTQAAYGAGLATGAFAAASYDLNTALGQLQAESGAYSGQIGVLQARIDVLQQQQKDGVALTQAEQAELATLLEARNRLADNTGILAAQERAHVLAMVGLNTEFGTNVTGADALAQASLNLGQAMGTGAVRGAELAQGINYAADAAAAARERTAEYQLELNGLPATVDTTVTADTAAASGAVQSYGQKIKDIPPATTTVAGMDVGAASVQLQIFHAAINSVPRTFTVTPTVNLGPALSALASFDAQLPHSPAKEGPFRILPNWDALFEALPAAAEKYGGEATKKLADNISAIAGAIKSSLEALTALGNFKPAKGGGLSATGFVGLLTPFIDAVVGESRSFKAAMLAAAGDLKDADPEKVFEALVKDAGAFVDTAGKVAGLLKSGVEGLTALADFRRPAAAAIHDFAGAIFDATKQIINTAQYFDVDGLDAAVLFSDAAGKVLGILKGGVEGLNALVDFKRPLDGTVNQFTQATNVLINTAAQLGVRMDEEFVKAADVWSGAAGKALGVLKAGVEGLMALGDFIRPTTQATDDFVQATNVLINLTAQMGAQMDKDFVKAAQVWADGAGKALTVLGTGVEGLLKLATFVAPSSQAIDAFAAAVAYLVRRFGEVAGQMGTEGVAAAGAFGTAANSALTAAKTGIDAFVALGKLSVPSREAIDQLLAGIQYTVGRMGEMADQFGKDGLARAVAFATAAGKVFTTLKDAVDLMVKLEELKKLPGEAIQTLLDGVKFAVAKAIDLVAEAQELERQSILFAGAMSRAAGNFAAGVGGSVPISAGAGGSGHTNTSNITNVNFSGTVYGNDQIEDVVVSAVTSAQSPGRL